MIASRLLIAILLGLALLKALFNPFPHSDIRIDDGADYFQAAAAGIRAQVLRTFGDIPVERMVLWSLR